MKRSGSLGALIAVCLVVAFAAPALAEFGAGMKAYNKKDYSTALREFKSAGNTAPANYNLGVMYFKGQGVQEDKKEGARLLRKAADQGHDKAQFLVGVIYFTGNGIEQNVTEGVKWIRKSADKGLPEAQFRLGMMYVNGDNIDKNRAEGVKWLKKSAKKGHADAKKLLTVMGE